MFAHVLVGLWLFICLVVIVLGLFTLFSHSGGTPVRTIKVAVIELACGALGGYFGVLHFIPH